MSEDLKTMLTVMLGIAIVGIMILTPIYFVEISSRDKAAVRRAEQLILEKHKTIVSCKPDKAEVVKCYKVIYENEKA